MKIKTSELQGAALDWAVLEAKNPSVAALYTATKKPCPPASTDWSQGGSVAECHVPMLMKTNGGEWIAQGPYDIKNDRESPRYYGPTLLIAAMRCYVASKLGDEIDVPEELK